VPYGRRHVDDHVDDRDSDGDGDASPPSIIGIGGI
jgi:hypothetical protein